jgi:hypothetical protein
MKTYTRQMNAAIPSHALPYLINGDASNLDNIDREQTLNWYQGWITYADNVRGNLVISPTGESEFFSHFPEFGLPCMCTECDIIVLVEDN